MQFPDARLLIFAKTPEPGRVKTRLTPLLGDRSAAAFHHACIEFALQRRSAARLAPAQLWLTPEITPELQRLARRFGVETCPQQGRDLGERMRLAADLALQRVEYVLLLGCDAPELPNHVLQKSLQVLQAGKQAVMVPAEDGGYVLLGLRQAWRELFNDMPWGSDRVAELTRQRCRSLGVDLVELEPVRDIDRPGDLARLAGPGGLPSDVAEWQASRWLDWLDQHCGWQR